MKPVDDRTLVPGMMDDDNDNDGTMISHSHDSMIREAMNMNSRTLESDIGTMVINSDGEDEDDSTMKRENSLFRTANIIVYAKLKSILAISGHDTAEIDPTKKSYRPLFLDHFDRKDAAAAAGKRSNANNDGKDNKELNQQESSSSGGNAAGSENSNAPDPEQYSNLYPPLVSHYSSRFLFLFYISVPS